MLGDAWVVFENFSVLFLLDGCLFQQNFCIFSARWVSILKKISVFVKQNGTHLQEIFSVCYATKLVQFTHKISVCICKMGIFSLDLLYI